MYNYTTMVLLGGCAMESQFEWRDEFNIGVESIDREHQRLFKIINKLFAFREEEKDSQWTCQEGIKYFKSHAVNHFNDEEAYMESIGYEGLEQHRRIHRSFREDTLPALEQELERTGYAPDSVDHFLGVCTGWLLGHTTTEDQAITGERASTWQHLLPGDELAAVKKVIVQLIFDMFRLESQVISDVYGGEKFGKGVYYRLVYGTNQGEKKQEVILVFEEKLLINTVGRAMGLQTGKLDTMLINAARYTARQFVGRVMEHLPEVKAFELKEENLLSYEQFRKIFERATPQVSLLFNTGGAGYFAYCAIAPHMLEEGVGTPIEHQNALTEVEKYLAKHEEEVQAEEADIRPKVLVVDDSMTVRQAIKNLLAEDYQVSLAESGVAAIRTITLDTPDLILLDYEMPVCNGKQTLEMLRSAKEFAKIPVIFLTGRDDPELVRELLSLKPAGYLLKHLKPDEIKRKIDTFFVAPQVLKSDLDALLARENALAEMEKGLAEAEERMKAEQRAAAERRSDPRPKVLLVDDSLTVRVSLKLLLENDYQVLVAESGAEALQTVAADRPDLILLDYEMPVCNGRQTLEMLRSVQRFAWIPVIFLTGRDDPELVRELLSLKPSGYLLKHLKPDELKEKIDAFFAKLKKA